MMKRWLPSLSVAVVAMALGGCDRNPSHGLKGQSNATITFYGLAVDQDANPLAGAQVRYQVEAYPKDWTFESRGRPYDVSYMTATSGPDGRFAFEVTGCLLKLTAATRDGYRHFVEEDTSDGCPTTRAYRLIAWSDLWYKSDPENPAVYVFVKDGVHEVSALPSRGGSDSGGGKNWTTNKPACPKKPSLKDMVQKKPEPAP